jgi:anti-anti-sigma factor
MSLTIHYRIQDGVSIFELDGSLDSLTVEQLEPEVLAVLDNGAERLLFDMAGVRYVTSTGVRVFILAQRRLQGKGRLAFAALQPNVEQIFNLLHLSHRHEVYPSIDDALVRLQA